MEIEALSCLYPAIKSGPTKAVRKSGLLVFLSKTIYNF